MKIEAGNLTLIYDESTLGFTIENKDASWSTLASFSPRMVYGGTGGIYGVKDINETVYFRAAGSIKTEEFVTGLGKGILTRYEDFRGSAEGLSFETLIWIEEATSIVRCEWIPLTEGKKAPTAIYWPQPMTFEENKSSWYTLVNDQQGLRIPNTWPTAMEKGGFAGYFGTAGAYMPWFAQVKDSQALLTICETFWNAAYDIDHPENGPYTHINVRWEPSLGHMCDRRVLQMRLLTGDHNDICKEYRRYAKEQGRLVTLKEKAISEPSVNDLAGVCFVHTGIKTHVDPLSSFYDKDNPEKNNYNTTFSAKETMLQKFHDGGVRKLYMHLDGWAEPGYDNCHPDYFPVGKVAGGEEGMRSLVNKAHELGFMFGIHDQYRDFYESAESFREDQATRLADGTIPRHARWAGGPQSYLCASQAPYFVRRNFGKLKDAGITLDGAYLDVFTCNEGDECTNPRHVMSRRDCYEYRKECFNYLKAEHILSSSEEVNDWAMPTLVFCHYAPYDFMLAAPGSDKHGIPVPLFNLVYHDCVVEPWMMDRVSKEEDYMLYALQNGGAPYLLREGAYPNTDGSFASDGTTMEEAIERCSVVQALHERVCQEEMLSCEFLNEAGTKQKISFRGGACVIVDFAKQTYEIL